MAQISVCLGDSEFPVPEWTDFAVHAVASWLENIVAFLSHPPRPPPAQHVYQLSFVDGPWAVLLDWVSSRKDSIRLTGVRKVPASHLDEDVAFEVRCQHDVSVESLLGAAVGLGNITPQAISSPDAGEDAQRYAGILREAVRDLGSIQRREK